MTCENAESGGLLSSRTKRERQRTRCVCVRLVDSRATTTAVLDLVANRAAHAVGEAEVAFRRRSQCSSRACRRRIVTAVLLSRCTRRPRRQRFRRRRPNSAPRLFRQLGSPSKRRRGRSAQTGRGRHEPERAQRRQPAAVRKPSAEARTTRRLGEQCIRDRMRRRVFRIGGVSVVVGRKEELREEERVAALRF